jgi:hypothetical protein
VIEALNWPTPRSEDAESCGNHPGSTDSLTGATRNWGTPRNPTNSGIGQESPTRGSRIEDQVRNWKTPHGMGNADRFGKTAGGGGEFAKQVTNWQTPKARGDDYSPNAKPEHGGGHGLGAQSRKWQTPATDSFRSRGGDRVDEPGLDQQARSWPTPNAHDAGGSRGKGFELTDGHTKPHDLVTVAKIWPTPTTLTGGARKTTPKHEGGVDLSEASACFHQDLTTSTVGVNFSDGTPRLNPRFVEMLMGLPLGWTDSAHVATESYRWWRLTHSAALRALLSRDGISLTA